MSVYFAKVGAYIKVGFSENPERRVAKLWQSGTRYARPTGLDLVEPELLLAIPGTIDTERRCHIALDDFAVGGEFFLDEPPVREFIAEAQRGRFPLMERADGPAFDGYVESRDLSPADYAQLRAALDVLFAGSAA